MSGIQSDSYPVPRPPRLLSRYTVADMPTWNIPKSPADERPPEHLGDWLVFETPAGARHLVGCVFTLGGREGQVSSAIQEWGPATTKFLTSSGRRYTLRGRPRGNLDSEYVMNNWLARNQVVGHVIVTPAVWSQIQAARRQSADALPSFPATS